MKYNLKLFVAVALSLLFSRSLWAGPLGELSGTGSYSRTNYSEKSFSTTKRYTAAIGINVTAATEVEVSFTTTDSFVNYDPIQTTTTKEQALSVSVIQSLVPFSWIIQPYAKVGAAQYNRQQTGTIGGMAISPIETKSPSGLLGAGARIFLLRNFSLKIEGVTFLPDLHLSEAKNNFAISGGFGWHF